MKLKRLKELTNQLNKYRDEYYNNSTSLISDYEYDELFDELKQLEEELGVVMAGSPTQSVGYEVKSKLEKVKHNHPMLSLDKTKSVDDILAFLGGKMGVAMLKMDGLTCSCKYKNGILFGAETRGDGEIGEDVTHNAKMIANLPTGIDIDDLVVDGEVIITRPEFDAINAALPEGEKYKHPRNLASGSVRQLDSAVAKSRNMMFIAWKAVSGIEGNSFFDRLVELYNLGFTVVPCHQLNPDITKEELENIIEQLKGYAEENNLPIDGIVFSIDDVAYGESLGATGHHLKSQIAFKFYDEEEVTTLREIEWTMAKTGTLTPTAVFDPVDLDGTEVSRASLHNISICRSLQLGIGDKITVYKANQIIPQVKDNLTKSNSFGIPMRCPICGGRTKINKDNNTEVLVCANEDCRGKLLGKLTHFCSKSAINIDGLSESTLEKFISKGWLNCFKDIYYLHEHKDEMTKMEKFGKKSVEKLLANIEKSRKTTLDRFLYSLCIPLIGKTASKQISEDFNGNLLDVMRFAHNPNDSFNVFEGIGEAMDTELTRYIVNYADEIASLANEFNFALPEVESGDKKLEGSVFVITGKLTHFKNRDELVNTIESHGGKVSGSVSAKTTALINNDLTSTSSKNAKAISLNIPILTEEDFLSMIS